MWSKYEFHNQMIIEVIFILLWEPALCIGRMGPHHAQYFEETVL